MTGALAYLTTRSVANRLTGQVARLRSPRYMLALLLGLGWLGFVVWQQRRPVPSTVASGTWVDPGGAVLVLALVVWAWVSGGDGRALTFSPAEVTFLFPAPMPRRSLVHYKLFRTQLLVLLNVVIWTLVTGRSRSGLPPALRSVAIWTLITTLSLHRLGAALVRTSLAEHGRFGLRHRLLSVGAVIAAGGTLAWGARDAVPQIVSAAHQSGPAFRDAVSRALSQGPLGVVVWPFRAMVRPLAARGPADWRLAMLPALGILLLHYLWVLRSDTAFEEAAAEASLARARRRETRRSAGALAQAGGRAVAPALFPLPPTGWPATALFWKNMTAVLRRRRARNIGLGLAGAGALLAATSGDPGGLAQMGGALTLTWLGFALLLGPQWIRNDLRGDLAHADLLRSYPLPGWSIVASETAASAVTLTLLQLGLALLAYLAYLRDTTLEVGPDIRLSLLVAAALLLPPINFMAMLLHNGAAVLFPGWVRIGTAASGVEALGQRLLSTTAFLVLLCVMLAAPLAASILAFQSLDSVTGDWAFGPAFLAALAVLALEGALLLRQLGRALERMDPGAISR